MEGRGYVVRNGKLQAEIQLEAYVEAEVEAETKEEAIVRNRKVKAEIK